MNHGCITTNLKQSIIQCKGNKHSADDKEVEMKVKKWLRQQSKDFYATGFKAKA
jgi:hypothetical protein